MIDKGNRYLGGKDACKVNEVVNFPILETLRIHIKTYIKHFTSFLYLSYFQGDSGGPLWTYLGTSDETRRAFIVGIVSRGSGCAVYNSPGIYTRVRAFVKWIDTARGIDQDQSICIYIYILRLR